MADFADVPRPFGRMRIDRLIGRASDLTELDPEVALPSRALAADWDRMGNLGSSAFHGSARDPPGVAKASGPLRPAPAPTITAAIECPSGSIADEWSSPPAGAVAVVQAAVGS
jgi:hypothetical protein